MHTKPIEGQTKDAQTRELEVLRIEAARTDRNA